MIWFVIALIAAIWVFIWMHEYDTFWCSIGLSILTLVMGSFLALLLTLVTSSIPEHDDRIWELSETSNIMALNDSTGVSGRMGYLGSGYVDSELYYYYMTKEDMGYRAKKIPASKTIIRYTSSDFKVETYSNTGFKKKSCYIYAVPSGEYYIAYIPEGAILEHYLVNLE